MNEEVWKDIPGYEGKYQVSSWGRVKSLKRKVRGVNHYHGTEFYRTVPEKILKPGRVNSGHLSVVLGHGANGSQVHQLVAKTFLGECPDGCEVLHGNGIPSDNHVGNLRYGTRTENILDTYKDGGRWRKLSIDDVWAIRFELLCGIRGVDIAKNYGVSPTIISNIKLRRIFEWLK